MDNKLKELMVPFYFGSLNETDRLFVERVLISDCEALIEFLDLKREIESAEAIRPVPSATLWARLKPKVQKRKAIWISLSLGAASAAVLVLSIFFQPASETVELKQPSVDRALFDSSSELPLSSSVL